MCLFDASPVRSGRRGWLAAACLVLAIDAAAQVPLEHPDLSLQAGGAVLAMARQADGGLVFGGRFDTVDGVPRAGLARLKPDGSLDLAWNPPQNTGYRELASCADGAVYFNSLAARPLVRSGVRVRLAPCCSASPWRID